MNVVIEKQTIKNIGGIKIFIYGIQTMNKTYKEVKEIHHIYYKNVLENNFELCVYNVRFW